MAACIFCGNRANSREDVIPQWLVKAALGGEIAGMDPEPGADAIHITPTADGESTREVRDRFGNIYMKICSGCNNGWMASLEGRVRPFLPQLIGAYPGGYMVDQVLRLDAQARSDLATWAMKTLMTFLHTAPGVKYRGIPAADFAHLYEHHRLSTRRTTVLAFQVPPTVLDRTTGKEVFVETDIAPVVKPYKGFVGWLRVGHFAVQINSMRVPAGMRLNPFAESRRALPLWPLTGQFVWPPAEAVSPAVFDDLRRGPFHIKTSLKK
ncbi:hypothetical protein [Streptomyces yangpuensis]|uniref:hypothetical protein n=1 Tax=Streptomyces yangpuensis TaxID=1648182 RepID=UPI00365AC98A